jgi:cytoskeletal protein RodZ
MTLETIFVLEQFSFLTKQENMGSDSTTPEFESLGTFLRNKRLEKRIKISDLINGTKIPSKALEAIEKDDFTALPAEAFTRGFYVLYAKHRNLDPQQILIRYEQARGLPPKASYEVTSIQGSEKPVNLLAAPPAISFSSLLGFVLVITILGVGGVCWYFSWNPATFISEQLRNFQNGSQDEENQEQKTPDEVEKKKNDITRSLGPKQAFAAPLVVMKGEKVSQTTKNGVVFITIPSEENHKK